LLEPEKGIADHIIFAGVAAGADRVVDEPFQVFG